MIHLVKSVSWSRKTSQTGKHSKDITIHGLHIQCHLCAEYIKKIIAEFCWNEPRTVQFMFAVCVCVCGFMFEAKPLVSYNNTMCKMNQVKWTHVTLEENTELLVCGWQSMHNTDTNKHHVFNHLIHKLVTRTEVKAMHDTNKQISCLQSPHTQIAKRNEIMHDTNKFHDCNHLIHKCWKEMK